MRKSFLHFITSCLFLVPTLGVGQSVTFNVTTATDNGTFSPKHVLAIWVKDANGNFVKSIKVMANTRIQYLYKWNKSSGGNKVDAITGATLTSHQSHTVIWNCKNTSNAVVPDGTYKMMIEYTDQHAQGPMDSVTFVISGSSQHVTQADQAYFNSISLDFTPSATGIGETNIANQALSVYPNPSNGQFNINYSTEDVVAPVTIKVFDLKGSEIYNEVVNANKLKGYPINLSNESKGVFILELTMNKKTISQKIVVN